MIILVVTLLFASNASIYSWGAMITLSIVTALISNHYHDNLTKLSRATGIPLRTLHDWKAQKSDWLHKSIERLTKIDNYLDEVEKDDNKKIN